MFYVTIVEIIPSKIFLIPMLLATFCFREYIFIFMLLEYIVVPLLSVYFDL